MDDEELAAGGEPRQEGEEDGEGSHEDSAPEIITMPSRFDQVQEKGYIDVWWLYDDGGKTKILLPLWLVCIFLLYNLLGMLYNVHVMCMYIYSITCRFGHSASFPDLP